MSYLISYLRNHKDNRGMMANLKCALIHTKRHMAWPILNKIGIEITNDVEATIAGLYATHPEESIKGNFGTTCALIKKDRNEKSNDDSKTTPIEQRFQHLLSSDTWRELRQRIIKFVLLAKNHNVPINYVELEKNLNEWSEQTKTNWASSFWTP